MLRPRVLARHLAQWRHVRGEVQHGVAPVDGRFHRVAVEQVDRDRFGALRAQLRGFLVAASHGAHLVTLVS